MQRLINAESLKELFPDNGEGSWTYNATVKAYIDAQPTIELEPCGDTISRKAAIEDVGDGVYTGSKIRRWLKSLPSIQPKGTRLSTVCLLCKKPAVTFNTEDDIPYTNYSYCEDCLRKGLKLLREQKKICKNSNAAIEKDVAVEAISDELMSRFDISATYAYEVAETAVNRIEMMAKEMGDR